MYKFTRRLILVALLLIAIICYGYGNSTGGSVFLFAGVMFELIFMFGKSSKLGKISKEKHHSEV